MLAIPKWAKIKKVPYGQKRIFVPVVEGNPFSLDYPQEVKTRAIDLVFDGNNRYEAYCNELSTYYYFDLADGAK